MTGCRLSAHLFVVCVSLQATGEEEMSNICFFIMHSLSDVCFWFLQANKTVVMQMLTNHPALAYLKDHMVQGTAILPAAALLELSLASAQTLAPKRQLAVVNAGIMSALSLTDSAGLITCRHHS